MRAIDTNVLLRLIERDDAEQSRQADLCVTQGAWVSYLVLAEALWVLTSTYKHRRTQIAQAIEMLLKHQSVVLQDADVVAAALAAFKANGKIEFSDCLILEIARKAGHAPMMTLDRDFGKLNGVERI